MDSKAKATLSFSDGRPSVDFPIYGGTIGPDVIDVRSLYAKTGAFTYDPGFMSTASCKSQITYIDGDQGVLQHRGYPIEQLVENCDLLEVAYLIMKGELPNAKEKKEFDTTVTMHTMVHEQMARFYQGFRRDAHPMAVLCGVVGGMAAFYHDSIDINDPKSRMISEFRLIAKMPTIVAMTYKYNVGQPFMYPRNDLGYVENFMRMMFGVPCEDYKPNPVLVRALEKILILHVDHEQNASTSTVRLVGSTGANPYACVAAGIAALWGPAHGGANEAVLTMLEEIGRPEDVAKAVEKAKDKNSTFRLMGFGHRVYKNYDPRAAIIREMCHKVLAELGVNDPLLEVAMRLEEAALKDEYFVARKLYPNVDFYSGLIYKALGIPTEMFTVMFALARTAGWVSHWLEQQVDPEAKIGRPRQIYTGATPRDYVALDKR